MATAAQNESYGDPRWSNPNRGPWNSGGRGAWGWSGWCWGGDHPGWNGHDGDAPWGPPWGPGNPFWAPHLVPKPVLIALTILGFMLWWPIGLVLLTVMIWRRQIFCGYRRYAGWQSAASRPGTAWKNWFGGKPPSSGNRAFDEYRAETLRRLEEEQKDFSAFLDRLRFAKDKAEFDQFMNERRKPPQTPPSEPPAESPS